MSPELSRVVERAKNDPEARFNSLAHYLDEAALKRAFARIRKDAATGVDGVSKEEYAEHLDENIRDLNQRLRTQQYRHQLIRRVHIPKGPGSRETRPIGISTIEDKIVQGALREVLEAIYEQDFLPCSYGFRPGRSAHDALGVLDRMLYGERIRWVLEADIRSFFRQHRSQEADGAAPEPDRRRVVPATRWQVSSRGRPGRRGIHRAG